MRCWLPMKIPTGCTSIDEILEGGLSSEDVTLVYGEPETGKTTLAMQCAINCAKLGCKVLYVDSDYTFSARRLSQMTGSDYDRVAELIILMRPTSFREQTAIVDKAADYVCRNFGLIIFDTITTLYRVKVSESPSRNFELNREINRQLAFLTQLAKTQKLSVLLTSQVRSVFDEASVAIEPVASRVLKFWADTIIELKPTENAQTIIAILEKCSKRSRAMVCNLNIKQTGINEQAN
jgi:DNA repair protein RadB